MKDELRAVVARLEKVERQTRRMKYAGIVVVMLAGAAVLMGQAAPKGKTIEAEKFVVVDNADHTRAILGYDDDGTFGLWIRSEVGKPRLGLGILTDESVGLGLSDIDGKTRASLVFDERGRSRLHYYDGDGKLISFLFLRENGSAGLTMRDGNGQIRADLSLNEHGAPALTLINKRGKVIWSAP